MKPDKFLITVTVAALIFKLFLFVLAEVNAPQLKFEPDTPWYLEPAYVMAEKGTFARIGGNGQMIYDIFRTPGYPLYLAVFHAFLKIPLTGIIFSQVLMTVAAAWLVYLSAVKFGRSLKGSIPDWAEELFPKLAYTIVVLDPSSAVYSLMIMSEALFTLLMAGLLYFLISYLENNRAHYLFWAGLSFCAATFVRPISYYLGAAAAVFILVVLLKSNWKKAVVHTLIFAVAAYAGIGAWTLRNEHVTGKKLFSSSAKNNLHGFGLAHSYSRNEDPHSQGLPPWAYYANVSSRCFMSLMTRPVNFKYFNSKPVKIFGKVITYPFLVAWLIGFIYGCMKIDVKNAQQMLAAMCICYFIVASIGGVTWFVGPRFRMPMMPFIALFAAYGWVRIGDFWRSRQNLPNKSS